MLVVRQWGEAVAPLSLGEVQALVARDPADVETS